MNPNEILQKGRVIDHWACACAPDGESVQSNGGVEYLVAYKGNYYTLVGDYEVKTVYPGTTVKVNPDELPAGSWLAESIKEDILMKTHAVDSPEVIKALERFEHDTERDTAVIKISGGFAKAEIKNYDENYFDIELKWGVQSDCENNVYTEEYKMDRKTLSIKEA